LTQLRSSAPKKLCEPRPETIDPALDLVIVEYQSNRLAIEAHERFVKSGIQVKGVCTIL
jgi:hypothetical protein